MKRTRDPHQDRSHGTLQVNEDGYRRLVSDA
jgi:hypothetical protein